MTLNVAVAGPRGAPPIILLHGFPESSRTWREVAPRLEADHFLVMPDQRGFGDSDRPRSVEKYRIEQLVGDLFALADALELSKFTLVGHDWGGAVAWSAALASPGRIERLVIVNAPHPLVFQKSVIEDEAQRQASQYIRAFRNPGMEDAIAAMGYDRFFEKTFGAHVDINRVSAQERQIYLDQWSRPGAMSAMLNWYRASLIEVPAPGEEAEAPAWTLRPFPRITVPTLVVWGLRDSALLPVQLGLSEQVEDLRLALSPDSGHFICWEEGDFVASAIRDFMAEPL
jgi:pimeloyl-ACP methyl ester carboxylesterase